MTPIPMTPSALPPTRLGEHVVFRRLQFAEDGLEVQSANEASSNVAARVLRTFARYLHGWRLACVRFKLHSAGCVERNEPPSRISML